MDRMVYPSHCNILAGSLPVPTLMVLTGTVYILFSFYPCGAARCTLNHWMLFLKEFEVADLERMGLGPADLELVDPVTKNQAHMHLTLAELELEAFDTAQLDLETDIAALMPSADGHLRSFGVLHRPQLLDP